MQCTDSSASTATYDGDNPLDRDLKESVEDISSAGKDRRSVPESCKNSRRGLQNISPLASIHGASQHFKALLVQRELETGRYASTGCCFWPQPLHQNYTKSLRLYLQQMQELSTNHPTTTQQHIEEGIHIVLRSWGGISFLLISSYIERVLMRGAREDRTYQGVQKIVYNVLLHHISPSWHWKGGSFKEI